MPSMKAWLMLAFPILTPIITYIRTWDTCSEKTSELSKIRKRTFAIETAVGKKR